MVTVVLYDINELVPVSQHRYGYSEGTGLQYVAAIAKEYALEGWTLCKSRPAVMRFVMVFYGA